MGASRAADMAGALAGDQGEARSGRSRDQRLRRRVPRAYRHAGRADGRRACPRTGRARLQKRDDGAASAGLFRAQAMTTLQYRPAVRLSSKAMIGLGGPSGGGKTLSALKIARGLCMGVDEQIFGIDTENGRMLAYAPAEGEKPGPEKFAFQYLPLEPPFSPMAYQEAIAVAVKAK